MTQVYGFLFFGISLAVILVNVFIKVWWLDFAAFLLMAGVLLTTGLNEWLVWASIVVGVAELCVAIGRFWDVLAN